MRKLNDHFISSISLIRDAITVIDRTPSQIALVIKSGRLEGVVTDGDIRRALLIGETLDSPVDKVMQKNFKFLPETATEQEALALMQSKKLKQIPVLSMDRRVVKIFLLDDLIKPMHLPNDVVIMAGGEGRRLGALTKNCPKPMLKVNDKPILEIILEQCIQVGFANFYFSVNYLKQEIKNYFQDGSRWNVRIHYLEEAKPLGTAGSLSLLPHIKKNSLLILNGDVLTRVDFDRLLHFHNEHNADISLCIKKHNTKIPYGIVRMDDLRVVSLEEKPILTHSINAGIYVLKPKVLDLIPNNILFDMPQLLKIASEKKFKVMAFPIHEYWQDLGYPEALLQTGRDW
jgi:dTDP-glucose pyrophosphorylase